MECRCKFKSWIFVLVLLILVGEQSLAFASSYTNLDYLVNRLDSSEVHVKRDVENEPPPLDDNSLLPQNVPLFILDDPKSPDDGELISFQHKLFCAHISNGLVRQFRNQLYLLSANQLFRLDVLPDTQSSLFPLATFEPFTESATDFSIQAWGANMSIVAIAFRTHYIIHRVPTTDNTTGHVDESFQGFNQKRQALQQILISHTELRSIKMKLFAVKEELFLLRAETNDQNSSSTIS